MADLEQALEILERLALAYPERRLERSTLRVYCEHLAEIPPDLLRRAADQHINTSNFFPRIAELRLIAQQIAGVTDFRCVAPSLDEQLDALFATRQKLEQAFYFEDELDPAAWQALSRAYAHLGRTFAAEGVLQRLADFQDIAAWTPEQARARALRYAEWNQTREAAVAPTPGN